MFCLHNSGSLIPVSFSALFSLLIKLKAVSVVIGFHVSQENKIWVALCLGFFGYSVCSFLALLNKVYSTAWNPKFHHLNSLDHKQPRNPDPNIWFLETDGHFLQRKQRKIMSTCYMCRESCYHGAQQPSKLKTVSLRLPQAMKGGQCQVWVGWHKQSQDRGLDVGCQLRGPQDLFGKVSKVKLFSQ